MPSRTLRLLRRSTFLLLGVQLLSGAIYAFYYPTLAIWKVNRIAAEALQQAGEAAPPRTRFVIDPAISTVHSEGYVAHAVLRFSQMPYEERESVQFETVRWKALIERGELPNVSILQQRDAAVVHSSRPFLRYYATTFGWSKAKHLAGGFELWLNTTRAAKPP